MGMFLNIFGSALLILAGIIVCIMFFKESPTITEKKRINFKTWIYIAILAVSVRWVMYLLTYWSLGSTLSFLEHIKTFFQKCGDSPHYLYLAEHGYASSGEKANLIVFYPLYPLLIKIFNVIFNNYFISGIIVSNLSFMITSCVFYELLRIDFDSEKAASGLAFMFVAPFSMFYSAIFTESIFILCTVLCLYFMRIKKPIFMAISGFFACLSRTQGIILFICALIPVISDLIKNKKINLKELICAFVIPIGFLIYLLINKIIFDDWFKYIEFQAIAPWYNKAQWFGKTLTYNYEMALDYPGLANILYWPQLALFFIGTLSIFYGVFKKVRVEYLVYTGVYIFVCYTSGWLISGSRYMCACLPLYIIFASCKNRYIRFGIILLSLIACFIYTKLWLGGHAIM